MKKTCSRILGFLRPAFTLESVFCRLIAVWLSFAAVSLVRSQDFSNLAFAQDTHGSAFLLAVLLFILYTLLNAWLKALPSDSWLLFIAATFCAARWLTGIGDSQNKFLFACATALAYGAVVFWCVQKNAPLLQKWQPGRRTVWIAVLAGGACCGFFIASITCYRYLTFSSPNFDFGIFVQMLHNMKETGLPLVSCERDVLMSHLAVHVSPICYVLLPLYAVFPSPLTLQIAQALILASGVIPVALLCRHLKLSGKITVLVALLYSCYPAISTGCFYDFHENCFLTPLLLWMFFFFERKKYLPMYLFAALTLTVKEDAAVYVLLFALFALIARRKLLHGSILAVGSLAYFGIALSVLETSGAYYAKLYADATPNPAISGPMINRFDNLIYNSDAGLIGAVKTALVNPGYLLTQLFAASGGGWEKLLYLLQMLLPLGFLPFCSKKPSRWLLLSPILLNLLTSYVYQYDIGFQYHFGITAFFFYAAILNLPELKAPSRRSIVSLAAVACLCLQLTLVYPNFSYYRNLYRENRESYETIERLLDTVPKDASVAADTFLLAHVADRAEVYETYYHGITADVDYVILDARYQISQRTRARYFALGYTVETEQPGLLLILKKTVDN